MEWQSVVAWNFLSFLIFSSNQLKTSKKTEVKDANSRNDLQKRDLREVLATKKYNIINLIFNWFCNISSEKLCFPNSVFKIAAVDVADITCQGSFVWCQWTLSAWWNFVDYVIKISTVSLCYKTWIFMDVFVDRLWMKKDVFFWRMIFKSIFFLKFVMNWHSWLIHEYPYLLSFFHETCTIVDDFPWTRREWSTCGIVKNVFHSVPKQCQYSQGFKSIPTLKSFKTSSDAQYMFLHMYVNLPTWIEMMRLDE